MQRIVVTKLTRLTHQIVIQLCLVAESCSIAVLAPGWKLLDTPLYVDFYIRRALEMKLFSQLA
jgi:hypothetical protein